MNPGVANYQGAAASPVVLPLPAAQEEQSAWVWGGEGCHGWGDALNQAVLPGAEGRREMVSTLHGLPCEHGTQSLFF